MNNIDQVVFWESASFHLAWLALVFLGITAALFILRSRHNHKPEAIAYSCFAWSLLILVMAVVGVYWNWQLLIDQIGAAGDVPWEALKAGLLRTFIPAAMGLIVTIGLFILATVLRPRVKA